MKNELTFLELIAEIDIIREKLESTFFQEDSKIIYKHRILAVQRLRETIQHLNDEVDETLGHIIE